MLCNITFNRKIPMETTTTSERAFKYISVWRLVANHLNMASPLGGCSFWRGRVRAGRCLACRWLVSPSCLCHPPGWWPWWWGQGWRSGDQFRIWGRRINSCPLLALVHILWLHTTNSLMVHLHTGGKKDCLHGVKITQEMEGLCAKWEWNGK